MAQGCFLRLFFLFLALCSAVHSQSVPPLQWLNITNLLQGSAKPIALKDAVIGYDSDSSTVVIFGGESSSGIPQSVTYLLDTQSLSWVTANSPTGLTTAPPARSGAVSGDDFAASNRHGFIVIGGKGNNNEPLSDVWEFDYGNQFWTQVTITPSDGPSARWGAAGGRDIRSSSITDPVIPGPNNSFYYTGGFDGSSLEPLSNVWRLNISGVLSSNNPTSVSGSWQEITINNFNSLSTQNLSGTMVMDSVAVYGGCATTSTTNNSCATQNAYSLDIDTRTSTDPNNCPAPRFGAVMTPNLNSVSATSTQVMLLLGTFNSSLWSDDSGLDNGEVDFWDVGAGTWIRVIPSGDPGSSASHPTPREGSAAVSSAAPIFGNTSGTYSDTLIFGGRDLSGNYLDEVWVLRAYNGAVTSSNTKWAGFGDGTLQTGVNASGTGVDVEFITTCATAISSGSSSASSSSSSQSGSATSSPKPSGSSKPESSVSTYDTSTVHKVLAPLSVTLLSASVILGRIFPPVFDTSILTLRSMASHSLILLVCLGLGIAGLVSAFTSISLTTPTSNLSKRTSSTNFHLHTGHGIASLAFFIVLYGVLPLLWLLSGRFNRPSKATDHIEGLNSDKQHITSADTVEKTTKSRSRTPSRPSSPRRRTHSWGPSILWRPSTDRGDSDSNNSADAQAALTQTDPVPAEPPRTFEVVNRPPRVRRMPIDRAPMSSLRDIDWLQRRRSLNTADALDYALTENQRSRERALLSTSAVPNTPNHLSPTPEIPDANGIVLHILLQSSILGLAIISLIKLWSSSLVGFIVFLIWTVAFYITLVVLAWNGKPKLSILAVILTRLRAKPAATAQEVNQYLASQSPPLSAPDHYAFPQGSGPYYHEPPFQAVSTDLSHGDLLSVETDEDDDEDEDARQQRIESEMARREIVTVTVPRRKLLIANPS
ncbi:hypothetical protein F5879DRAFT_930691 [Lentinula edodes]|uniref:uncharacterized protein n=1 Tax=Lentinula edodes TaxID=5353 RepID=UPI001E8D1B3D|nr:uncharacterized protein C8R40DRAFT_1083218 [Lentinula edodes]KAH7879795.1 hypothetical protein C8R40DRAFT_1083218 [Lentinula edodes]KAJ3910260.1 hypothetical protein F5879DRAFT_930691 [Lentinula edodes]